MELEKYARNYPFDDFAAWFSVWAEDLLKNLIEQESPRATMLHSNCTLKEKGEGSAVAGVTSRILVRNPVAKVVECETNFMSEDDGQSAECARGCQSVLKDIDAGNVGLNHGSLDSSWSNFDDHSGNRIYRSPPANNRIASSPVMHTRALKLISSRNGNYSNCSTTAREYSKISRELFGFHRHRKVIDKPRRIDFSSVSDQRYVDAEHHPLRSPNMLS